MTNTPEKKERSLDVNVFLKKEDGLFVAHCLEFDIVAVAKTEEQAKEDLKDLVTAQIAYAFANDNLDNLFRPAPKSVWEECFTPNETEKGGQSKEDDFVFLPSLSMKMFDSKELCYA